MTVKLNVFELWVRKRPRASKLIMFLFAVFALGILGSFGLQFAKMVKTGTTAREYVYLRNGVPFVAQRENSLQRREISKKQFDDWLFYEHMMLLSATIGFITGGVGFALFIRELYILGSGDFLDQDKKSGVND